MLPHLQNIATWARGSLDFWQRAEVYPTIHPSGEFWWLERPDLHTLWQSEPQRTVLGPGWSQHLARRSSPPS